MVSVQTNSKFDHLIFIYGPRGFKYAEGFLPRAAPASNFVSLKIVTFRSVVLDHIHNSSHGHLEGVFPILH